MGVLVRDKLEVIPVAMPNVAHGNPMVEELEGAVGKALLYTAVKTGRKTGEEVIRDLSSGDEWSQSYMTYMLAREISVMASAVFPEIRESYVAGLQEDESASVFYPAIVILCVETATRALEHYAKQVEAELPAILQNVAGCSSQKSHTLLNITLLGTNEVREGTGFAAAITSLFSPPLRVWPE
jgi:hypothetical protein